MKSIKTFDNPLEIIEEYKPDALTGLPENARDELDCALNYESIMLYVIDDSIVQIVDAFTGEVYGEDTMDEFVAYSLQWARENAIE